MANLDYTNYSFDDLVEQLTNRLKERGAWKDTYRSSTGQMLIELFSYVANMVLYYVERRAEESYLLTAKNKSSVINLVRLLNYLPKRKVSATGVLKFTLSEANSRIVFIPKYTECTTSAGVKYLVSQDVAVLPGQTYVEVTGIQGELVTLNYVSNGALDQEYKIDDVEVENTNIFVSINGGSDWAAVTSFINSDTASEEYLLKTNLDDTVSILFGNNIFGKAPDSGDAIQIQYIRSEGLDGNVYETDRITTLNATIYDQDGAVVSGVTVTNTSTFLGGDDAETMEEIREEAPKVFATGDRAVTKADFTAILNNYPGVADSNVWGESEEIPPNYDLYNQVRIVTILQNWALPDATFEEVLADYLYTKSLLTVRYSFIDPDILEIIPTLTIKVLRGNDLSYVNSQIQEAIENDFVLGDTTRLGISKRLSDITAIVEGITGVSHSYVELLIRKDLSDTYNSLYDWAENLGAVPLLESSVNVYIGDVLVATDDGLGNFTDVSSTYTITGDIDYTTGEIGLNVSPAVTYPDTIYVIYRQDEEGDVVVTKNQICKLYEIDVQNIEYVS